METVKISNSNLHKKAPDGVAGRQWQKRRLFAPPLQPCFFLSVSMASAALTESRAISRFCFAYATNICFTEVPAILFTDIERVTAIALMTHDSTPAAVDAPQLNSNVNATTKSLRHIRIEDRDLEISSVPLCLVKQRQDFMLVRQQK